MVNRRNADLNLEDVSYKAAINPWEGVSEFTIKLCQVVGKDIGEME
jgi:hypothetical protein